MSARNRLLAVADILWMAKKGSPLHSIKDLAGEKVGFTTEEFAKTGGTRPRVIIEARREGVNYIMAHPDEAAEITARAYNGDAALYKKVFAVFANAAMLALDRRVHHAGR